MRISRYWIVMVIPVMLFANSCNSQDESPPLPAPLTEEHVLEHIRILSSDEYGGRTPGTIYEDKTVSYIVEQFKRFGVEPGMPDNTYIQKVSLMGQSTRHTEMHVVDYHSTSENQSLPLSYRDDFMVWPSHTQEKVSVEQADLVYVGYGIDAPEEDWDDYKGTDISGKIAIFKNFNPVSYEDRFDGGHRLYYGRWTYKYEQAKKRGAIGALIIHTDETAGYGWDVVRNSWSLERFFVLEDSGSNSEFEGWLTRDQSQVIFDMADLNLEEMLNAAESPDFEPVPLEDVQLNIQISADYRSIEGKNVVGKLPGSDPSLKEQAVIFSAHHDHLGFGSPVEGDSIFNGAWDNASGVSLLLNLARLYGKDTGNFRRSLYFATVTAEESGLLGSHYLATNAPVHPGNISVNINLDATNIFGKTRDIVDIGYGRSDIDTILEEEARRLNRTVKPDQNPEQGFYYRSDHFSFAKQGIPALYPNRGNDFINKPENYIDQVRQYKSLIYHSVHDRIHDWWDLSGAVEDLKLVFYVSKRIANEDALRQWNPGEEFEQIRLQRMGETKTH